MDEEFSNGARADATPEAPISNYYGLSVVVLCRMRYYSLVRYRDREFIVSSEDLCSQRAMKCGA